MACRRGVARPDARFGIEGPGLHDRCRPRRHRSTGGSTGRPGDDGREAVRDDRGAGRRRVERDHDLSRGHVHGGLALARRHLRDGHRGGPGAAGLHDQRLRGERVRRAHARPVRRGGRPAGGGHPSGGRARAALPGRPAAHPAGHPVREPTRLHDRAGDVRGHGGDGGTAIDALARARDHRARQAVAGGGAARRPGGAARDRRARRGPARTGFDGRLRPEPLPPVRRLGAHDCDGGGDCHDARNAPAAALGCAAARPRQAGGAPCEGKRRVGLLSPRDGGRRAGGHPARAAADGATRPARHHAAGAAAHGPPGPWRGAVGAPLHGEVARPLAGPRGAEAGGQREPYL